MDIRQHEHWNEEMARLYNPDSFLTKSGPLIQWVGRLRMKATARALNADAGIRMVDVGCGPGNLLPYLSGAEIVGVDLSDTLLAQARDKVAGRAEVKLVKAPAEKIPFPDAYFDRAVCSEVLEHVLDPEAVMREIRRVCKPGARVVLTVPNETLINATKRVVLALGLKRWVAGDYPMSDDMLNQWHRAEIEEDWILERAKGLFEPVASAHVPFWPLSYHHVMTFRVTK